ncbi:MAG: malate dehydrogenase [Gammaproteobacteria bacterium]|jgi:malic enzyme|nr:malate dehydrogenase [Gammaproteobacteria bacterium]
MSDHKLKQQALDYHRHPKPGKLAVSITKPTATQQDLSLAYSPGVAEPVLEIAKNPEDAYAYTNKGNLVAVITNGTAILGLGNLGALASKPVMEGKAVLFKKFADIDVFDIEVNADTISGFVETVANISPTFGGINLEDIKAPECFAIEYELKQRLTIPVFHDDQHGTAIIVAAGLLNALELQGKNIETAKIVCLGAGAAGIATMQLLVKLGAELQNIFMVDREGIIHSDRHGLGPYKFAFARHTEKRSLSEAMEQADVFIGVSGPNLVTTEQVKTMASKPIIFALSNPNPEIHPDLIRSIRSDAIIATGRSDMPNQVNNVLCFPYIFRAALDVRARVITTSMCIAAVHAIRQLAKEPVPSEVLAAYPGLESLSFGPDYIIPKPTDPRLKEKVAPAVAKAAIVANVAALAYPSSYPELQE